MRGLMVAVVLVVSMVRAVCAQTVINQAIPAAEPPALTEAERCSVDSLAQRATIVALRAEIAKLQARVAELEAPLVQQAVQKERAELEQRFRDRLKPADGSVFDWSTLTFTPAPTKPPPASPPQ